jgi:hypothetical protein
VIQPEAEESATGAYVPYKTFVNFVDSLKVGMPSHDVASTTASFNRRRQPF